MAAEPKKKEESLYRTPGVKHQRTGTPAVLRMPHDDLVKPEAAAGTKQARIDTSVGAEPHSSAGDSRAPTISTEQGSGGVGEHRANEKSESSRPSRPVAVSTGSAAAVAQVEVAPGTTDNEAWLRFQQQFGGLLRQEVMHLCRIVYERCAASANGVFDTKSKEVAELAGESQRNTFRLLEKMERNGFLRRENITEGRQIVGMRLTFINPFSRLDAS